MLIATTGNMSSEVRARFVLCLVVIGFLIALPADASNDPMFGNQYGLDKIQAEKAWSTGTGVGATVAVIDTGVQAEHEDLAAKMIAGFDFVDGDEVPQDGNRHGTHVAGIAAAVTNNGIGVAGVAPGACVMPVRVLNNNGSGAFGDIRSGIRWAADQGAQVINLSLGEFVVIRNLDESAMKDAITYAYGKGVVVAVAAGNDVIFPSGYRDVDAIAVAATDRRDEKPAFSNGAGDARFGMSAPGAAILSTVPNGYGTLSGTSMATPHVAGAAAVLRSLGLSRDQTIKRLLDTADDIGIPGHDPIFGSGRLNLAKAVEGLKPRTGGPSCRAAASQQTKGPAAGSAPAVNTGSTSGGEKGEPSKGPAGSSQKTSGGTDLSDYKDPEPGTLATGEKKKGLSPKTMMNIGIAVVLIGVAVVWYLWFRRRAIPEE